MPIPSCDICGGVVKPDRTFFGEEMPMRFQQLVGADAAAADALLVMGTSLAVYPVCSIPGRVRATCPRVLINREVVGPVLPPDDGADGGATGSAASGVGEEFDAPREADDDAVRDDAVPFRFGRRDNYRDVCVLGSTDDGVRQLARALDDAELERGGDGSAGRWERDLDELKRQVTARVAARGAPSHAEQTPGASPACANDTEESAAGGGSAPAAPASGSTAEGPTGGRASPSGDLAAAAAALIDEAGVGVLQSALRDLNLS